MAEEQITNNSKDNKISVGIRELIKRRQSEPEIKKIWGPLTPKSVGYFVGPPKSGKTTAAENLGMSIAAGLEDFLGMKIDTENKKVLFISLEEYWANRTGRNEKQIKKICADIDKCDWLDNYIVANEYMPKFINSREDWGKIVSIIAEHKPVLVILDSLTHLYYGKIEEAEVAKKLISTLKSIAAECDTAILLIHHMVKGKGEAMGMSDIAGSRILNQEMDYAFGFNKTVGGKRYMKVLFDRYENDDFEKVALYRIDDNQWLNIIGEEYEYKIVADEKPSSDGRFSNDSKNKLLEWIKINKDEKNQFTSGKMLTDLVETKVMSKDALYSTAIEKLISEKVIRKAEKGVYELVE